MSVKELVPGFSDWVRVTLKRELRRRNLTVSLVAQESEGARSLADIQRNAAEGRVVVWTGASQDTIFDSPETNWAMRALHDLWHLDASAEFGLLGELYLHDWVLRNGLVPTALWPVFTADGAGQSLYCYLTGEFPDNQWKFCSLIMGRMEFGETIEEAVRGFVDDERH